MSDTAENSELLPSEDDESFGNDQWQSSYASVGRDVPADATGLAYVGRPGLEGARNRSRSSRFLKERDARAQRRRRDAAGQDVSPLDPRF